MCLIGRIRKLIKRKKMGRVAKDRRHDGKSIKNGNAPSPYTKYGKTPYKYSFETKKVVFLDTEKDKRSSQKIEYDRKKRNKRKAA